MANYFSPNKHNKSNNTHSSIDTNISGVISGSAECKLLSNSKVSNDGGGVPNFVSAINTMEDADHRRHITPMEKVSERRNVPGSNTYVAIATSPSDVTSTSISPDYSHDETGNLSKLNTPRTRVGDRLHVSPVSVPGESHDEEDQLRIRRNDMNQGSFGAMQNITRRGSSDNHILSPLSQYLILSPSNPIRIFAITFLTHWIYSSVIVVTICAFVISSVCCNYFRKSEIFGEISFLQIARWVLLVTILLEIFIKTFARGLFVQKFSYLRISWDWLDIVSLILLFVSTIISWKAVEFSAAAIVLLKLIPIHPGSITAFIFLCSCAKKLIPVLVYGMIIVWIYGVLIFTLFLKYQNVQHDDVVDDESNIASKSNGSTSDNESENIASQTYIVRNVVEENTTQGKSLKYSCGLAMECLPTEFRSLSGSFIHATQMLTLRYSPVDSKLSLNSTSDLQPNYNMCQYETYTLSILEMLVKLSGTLPIITMSFAILCHFFQKFTQKAKDAMAPGENCEQTVDRGEDGENFDRLDYRRRTVSSIQSGATSTNHNQTNYHHQEPARYQSNCFNTIAKHVCDCEYYFCCLADIQRRLSPYVGQILNSKKFKVLLVLVMTTDILCMIVLLWFSKLNNEFSWKWLLLYYIQICFVFYTVEVIVKWFAVSSDEYWMSCWSAFDLTVVIVYWIGYAIIHAHLSDKYYLKFCGILSIRMLKLVPYWSALEQMLKLVVSSVMSNCHYLFVILICSVSAILLKYAVFALETPKSLQIFAVDIIPMLPLDFYTFVDSIFLVVFLFFSTIFLVMTFVKVLESLKASEKVGTMAHPSISFLLSHDSHFDDMQHSDPRQNLNDSSPCFVTGLSNGLNHHKYRLPSTSSTNGISHESRSMLSPSSDVLSPLLSTPIANGINGLAHSYANESNNNPELENVHDENDAGGTRPEKRSTFFSRYLLEDVFNITSVAVIMLSSLNIILDSSKNNTSQMTWRSVLPGSSMWIEAFFIVYIGIHIFYKTRLTRFSRETFLQLSSLVDLIVIIAGAVQLFSSGMKWVPLKSGSETLNGLIQSSKVLSGCRGLLLLSRVSWLQCIGSGLWYTLGRAIKHVAASGYLWLMFIISSISTQKVLTTLTSSRQHNFNDTNFIKSNVTSPTKTLEWTDNEDKSDFKIHTILVTITLLLLLLNMGIILGLLRHHLGDLNKFFAKYLTPSQKSCIKLSRERHTTEETDENFVSQPTKGTCVPILFFVTNHHTFDIVVMFTIFLDAIGITFEYYANSERGVILRRHYPSYMLFIYGFELSCKIGGNGAQFLKSAWNIFDCIVMTVSLIDFCVIQAIDDWVPILVQNVRFLRILRIFQFYPFVQRTQIIQSFFASLHPNISILWNYSTFYFGVYLAAIIFRFTCPFGFYESATHLSNFVAKSEHVPTVLWTSFPFQHYTLENIFRAIGNNFADHNIQNIFYKSGLVLLSLVKFYAIFGICFVLVATLYKFMIAKEDTKSNIKIIRSHSEQYDLEDKSSFTIPCISPDTIDLETSSSAGTSSRVNNTTRHMDAEQNCVYDSNGCKVFFVEAMITTV